MKVKPFLIHSLSPLHAGTGQAAEIIDLPIARMKATGIPFVPGSTIKGVLRDARETNGDLERVEAVFGPADDPAAHAGALVVSDARLLALPVRSFRGTFMWATSPLLLTLAKRDLKGSVAQLPVPTVEGRRCLCTESSVCAHDGRIFLEDIDIAAERSEEATKWAEFLSPIVSDTEDIFTKRFGIVDDETMAFLWETATQVDARVRLDPDTRTVASGALWLEESLPSETLLVGILAADQSRRPGIRMSSDEVLDFALPEEEVLQLGGKATIGRGRCKVIPL